MGNGNGMLVTNLGVVWKLLRPSWCPHPSPCEPDRGSHGVSEISPGGGRRSGNIEYSAQVDLASGEGVKRSDE